MMSSDPTQTDNRPVRTTPFPALENRYAGRELEYLAEALQRNNLFYTQKDGFVSRMLERAKQEFGAPYAVSASSGTAAVHVAIGAAEVQPCDEVITSPITDMGTLIGVLYQGAIPVFADVDARTYNLSAETVERAITPRTRAVIAVHLAGNPCDMGPLVALCKSRGITLIEDVAQSFGCRYGGRHVGSFGDFGCFSFNEFKHLSSGDGGIVVMPDAPAHARAHNFADKCYDRLGVGNRLSILCPNYRMTELQGAVALAQFDKMQSISTRRRELGDWLTDALQDTPGVLPPVTPPTGECSYWFYMFRVDESAIGIDRDEFARRLNDQGIPASRGYLDRPLYAEPVFANRNFFAGGVWPAERLAGREYDYRQVRCKNAELVLNTAIRLPLHQAYSQADIEDYAAAIHKVAKRARA